MTTVLATKPGINGANTLSIPKDWDSTWFRKFIANSLKGADVRNAVGANGIVVTGNIASPYATIGFGAPVTLPGPVTISAPSSGIPLTVNGSGGASHGAVTINVTSGYGLQIDSAASYAGISLNASGATGFTSDAFFFQNAGATGSGGTYLGTRNANTLHLQTNGADAITISGAGAVTIAAPSSAVNTLTINQANTTGANALAVNGSASSNTWLALFYNNAAATGSNYGVLIEAGTNSTDYGLYVGSKGNAAQLFQVRGDGLMIVGAQTGTLLSTLTSLTNGSGALVGTLTNSPVTGNPTKWIVINDNGTTRRIPAW